jgi:hypothetical protein
MANAGPILRGISTGRNEGNSIGEERQDVMKVMLGFGME